MNKGLLAGLLVVVLVVAGVLVFTGGDDEAEDTNDTDTSETEEVAEQNIVELAQSNPDLSILVDAVVAADLVDTLSGEGPFTVFAPTNAAFEALIAELGVTAEELLAREDLADILTYHVVSGEVFSTDLTDGLTATTVQGGDVTFSVADGVVQVNDATVVTADVSASNGVVHVIDTVLLP